jgi:hypothetical protein
MADVITEGYRLGFTCAIDMSAIDDLDPVGRCILEIIQKYVESEPWFDEDHPEEERDIALGEPLPRHHLVRVYMKLRGRDEPAYASTYVTGATWDALSDPAPLGDSKRLYAHELAYLIDTAHDEEFSAVIPRDVIDGLDPEWGFTVDMWVRNHVEPGRQDLSAHHRVTVWVKLRDVHKPYTATLDVDVDAWNDLTDFHDF